jgi:hypothetical protein
MTTDVFFFDTYALLELFRGNAKYSRYLHAGMALTQLNLFELYYSVLRETGERDAKVALTKYAPFAVPFDEDVIEHAAKLRFMHRKEKLSMTDCIGYVLARNLGILFLTGDAQFENKLNVEFVRK